MISAQLVVCVADVGFVVPVICDRTYRSLSLSSLRVCRQAGHEKHPPRGTKLPNSSFSTARQVIRNNDDPSEHIAATRDGEGATIHVADLHELEKLEIYLRVQGRRPKYARHSSERERDGGEKSNTIETLLDAAGPCSSSPCHLRSLPSQ